MRTFKENVERALREIGVHGKPEGSPTKDEAAINEAAVAKVLEEMKLVVREVSLRSEKMMIEGVERFQPRRFPLRRIHARMIDQMSHMLSRREGDPVGILILASLVRDEFPWLYELGMEAYRAANKGNLQNTKLAFERFRDAAEFTVNGPLVEEMRLAGGEVEGLHELPRLIHYFLRRVEEAPAQNGTLAAKVQAAKDRSPR